MESNKQQTAQEWAISGSEATGKISSDEMAAQFSHIKGWGIDADSDNDPTYPMKNWNGDDHKRLNYQRPVQQILKIEKLHSNERPSVSAVFGTSCPPSGVSGILRRQAFRYSEGRWAHWLILLLADRVNVVEGIVSDIRKGQFPNIIAERGWKAEWKYNRKGVVNKLVIGVAITAAAFILLAGRQRRTRHR